MNFIMAPTGIPRSITFDPASRINDFLGSGYSSKGVAEASLSSLSPMYPSASILWLSNLQRNSSPRTERAGDIKVDADETAFSVVMFNRINHNLPSGLSAESISDFFTALFTFPSPEDADAHRNHIMTLIGNPHYSVLAITAPMFSVEDPNTLFHHIVAAVLYTKSNTNGTFIAFLGCCEKGDPKHFSLTPQFYVDPANKDVLSDTATFRSKGLATFLLSTLQVLGSLGFKAPNVISSEPFHVLCDERVTDQSLSTHHLYLQARVETEHAYLMYVEMGFNNANDSFFCSTYQDDCPVHGKKNAQSVGAGYTTDDTLLRLLVLRKWVVNVWPASDPSNSSTLVDASKLWNAVGLSAYQYMSLSLVPPRTNKGTQEYTNAAYYQLLECSQNVVAHPYKVPHRKLSSFQASESFPVDRTAVTAMDRDLLSLKMITGPDIPPFDIRRSLFRSLVAVTQGDPKLDAFEAAAAAMYTEGNLKPNEHGIYLYSERALELRMNVIAFYLRCAHYSFTTPTLQAWSEFATLEYDFLKEKALLADYGLSDFDGSIPSFSEDTENRLRWDHNFGILASRLNAGGVPLWTDLHALQILFSQMHSPVYFALVYMAA